MQASYLLFSSLAYAGNVAHVRWKSPALRYEHLVDRTVHIVKFDVVRRLGMPVTRERLTIVLHNGFGSDQANVNITVNHVLQLAVILLSYWAQKGGCWMMAGV